MNTQEKFSAWLDSPAGNTGLCVVDTLDAHPCTDAWCAWQACAAECDKELAALQATLKEAADLKEKYDINEASNKAVELALEDVPYKGSYADGVEYLKQTIEQLQREKAMLVDEFEIFGYIEPRKNFEPMEAEAVYIVGEKDFDGCSVALYRRS